MGAALAIKGGLSALKKSAGVSIIVLFSSVAVLQVFSFHNSIAMAKGAVNAPPLSLAAALATGIRINAVAPSLTKTPLTESILANEKTASALNELHPLKKLGTSADIASLVLYLLSDQADWITGQIISIDGGRSTLRPAG